MTTIGTHIKTIGKHMKTIIKPLEIHMKSIGGYPRISIRKLCENHRKTDENYSKTYENHATHQRTTSILNTQPHSPKR